MGSDTDWGAVADSVYREFVEDERRERDQQHLEELGAEIARLRAEVEKVRVNAERYLWLRNKANDSYRSAPMVAANPMDRETTRLIHSEELDAAIDAAMGASA